VRLGASRLVFKDRKVVVIARNKFKFKAPKIFVIRRNVFTLSAIRDHGDGGWCLDTYSIIYLRY
jgi:hypothetical protein